MRKLGDKADEMVEEKFSSVDIKFEESDFSMFYNKFTLKEFIEEKNSINPKSVEI